MQCSCTFGTFFALARLNFSDLEIEIFCARYDKDGDYVFNLEEIHAIESNLGEQVKGGHDKNTIEQLENSGNPPLISADRQL